MAKEAYVKVGGSNKKVTDIYVKVAGASTAKKVTAGYVKVGGEAKQFWPSATPVTYKYFYASSKSSMQLSDQLWLKNPAVANEDRVKTINTGYTTRRAFIYGDTAYITEKNAYVIDYYGSVTTVTTQYGCTDHFAGAWFNDWQDEDYGACFIAGNTYFKIDRDTLQPSLIGTTSYPIDTAASSRYYKSSVEYDCYAYFSYSNNTTLQYYDGRSLNTLQNGLSEVRDEKEMLGWNFQTQYSENPWDHSKNWYGILIAGGANSKKVEAVAINGTRFILSDLPYTLVGHSMANLGNYILVAGGKEGGSTPTRTVYTFNGQGYTRSTTTQLSVARYGLKGGTIGNDWNGSTALFTNNAIFAGGITSSGASNATDRYYIKRQSIADQGTILKSPGVSDLSTAIKNHAAISLTSNSNDRLAFGFGENSSGVYNEGLEYFTGSYITETLPA